MIDRYSLHNPPADKVGEYCEHLPQAEVKYLQDLHNVNLTDAEDNGEAYFDEEFHIADLTIVGPEYFLSDWS